MLSREDNSKEQQDLLWALIQDYNAIYYINLDKNSFIVLYANNVVNQNVKKQDFEKGSFSNRMTDFVKTYVRDEDQSMLLQLTDCEYIKKRFENKTAKSE